MVLVNTLGQSSNSSATTGNGAVVAQKLTAGSGDDYLLTEVTVDKQESGQIDVAIHRPDSNNANTPGSWSARPAPVRAGKPSPRRRTPS